MLGKSVGIAVLLVGLSLTACSSPQVVEKMRAHRLALAKAGQHVAKPDQHKPPAAIPDAMAFARKEEIPRAGGRDEPRPAKPTIRF